jgi:hypothetical protein
MTFSKENSNGQKTHEKVFTISSHKGNANENLTKNSHHQKHHQQVLARMWGQRNPSPLLVGMQAGATTLEKNLETS